MEKTVINVDETTKTNDEILVNEIEKNEENGMKIYSHEEASSCE